MLQGFLFLAVGSGISGLRLCLGSPEIGIMRLRGAVGGFVEFSKVFHRGCVSAVLEGFLMG